ncbi:YlaF family protein [Radiobacillus kanasensis]|uniref:DUF5325 family protein n=1 Tax=Radiobacillus kanasensis TaxID=2844358 RepID=UPI001E32595A|nr:DUF5325 family protein [Radiobacillus kanasensis]UFU00893.1 YlaF family protein [Radiobacillus kanasensis]
MKNIQYPMLAIAILVIIAFSLVGITIVYRNYWLAGTFFILGFAIMGFGLRKKGKATE